MSERNLVLAAVVRGGMAGKLTSDDFDLRLARAIEAGRRGEDVDAELEEIFSQPELRDWIDAVRGDMFLRPPEVAAADGDRSLWPGLPGEPDVVSPLRFACPAGDDFTWFRQQAADEIPRCPTHDVVLVAQELR